MGFSQTPEQQKMIDRALKMRDSIMECMNLEEMLQQANTKEKRLEQKQKTNTKTSSITKAAKNEDKYWKNTLASENNTFKNWQNGAADLVYNYRYDSSKDVVEYVKVGVINSDGSIVLNATSKVPVLKSLNNFKDSNTFLDIHDSDLYQFSNEN